MTSCILITGASSGLGHAFLNHYTKSSPSTPIIALDNQPLPPETIASATKNKNITFHQIDITNEPSLHALHTTHHPTTPIHLLIHAAGIRGLVPSAVSQHPGDVAAADNYAVMDHATMLRTLETNTCGTFNILKAFMPNLLLASSSTQSTSAPSKAQKAKAIILSSRLASLSNNASGGAYAYRASKAALNAVVKSFAIDVPEVRFLLLHPGRVETGLVGWREEGAVGVEESVRDCLLVMEGVDGGGEGVEDEGDGGKAEAVRFVDRFGVGIAW